MDGHVVRCDADRGSTVPRGLTTATGTFSDNTTQDGAELAIDQINSAGGIGGQPVKWTRYPANFADPQQSLQLFLQAMAAKPGKSTQNGVNSVLS